MYSDCLAGRPTKQHPSTHALRLSETVNLAREICGEKERHWESLFFQDYILDITTTQLFINRQNWLWLHGWLNIYIFGPFISRLRINKSMPERFIIGLHNHETTYCLLWQGLGRFILLENCLNYSFSKTPELFKILLYIS